MNLLPFKAFNFEIDAVNTGAPMGGVPERNFAPSPPLADAMISELFKNIVKFFDTSKALKKPRFL